MDFETKRLQASDVETFRKLLDVLSTSFSGGTTKEKDMPDDTHLRSLLKRSDFYALAAVRADVVLGGLTGYELILPTRNRKELYLYDIAVDEKYRRQGVASALLAKLKTVCKDNGVALIFVEAESSDDEAVAFYSSLGADRLSVQHFNINLD